MESTNFDIAIVFINERHDVSPIVHEVHTAQDDIDARLILCAAATQISKKIYGDHFVGFVDHQKSELTTVSSTSSKILSDLKLDEVALVLSEGNETKIDVYTAETFIISGWTTTTSEIRPKNIGYFNYQLVTSNVHIELKNKAQYLESKLKDAHEIQLLFDQTFHDEHEQLVDLLSKKEELSHNVISLTIAGRQLEMINSQLNIVIENLTGELAKIRDDLRIRGDDCKRLVVENARLRDMDDKNYIAIMRLNDEISRLRSQTPRIEILNSRPQKEIITPSDVDIKPIKRITQDTLDESSYDQCIKKIQNFDRSHLKSTRSVEAIETPFEKLKGSSEKAKARSKIVKNKY